MRTWPKNTSLEIISVTPPLVSTYETNTPYYEIMSVAPPTETHFDDNSSYCSTTEEEFVTPPKIHSSKRLCSTSEEALQSPQGMSLKRRSTHQERIFNLETNLRKIILIFLACRLKPDAVPTIKTVLSEQLPHLPDHFMEIAYETSMTMELEAHSEHVETSDLLSSMAMALPYAGNVEKSPEEESFHPQHSSTPKRKPGKIRRKMAFQKRERARILKEIEENESLSLELEVHPAYNGEDVGIQFTPEVKTKRIQCNLKPKTVDIGIQCELLKPDQLEEESDYEMDKLDEFIDINDPDYTPSVRP
ncbi:hypothetical protein GQR58_002922 [Nymphon striatum]|nr:hypothetical protein GQR58_002922 [Nymphon striatum]